ncbi:MAG: hypothetical protein JST89_01880 [Cyanobacteria bacterium SZAS-4]|nr:hypothetical protein [Cyanobacteria bacterium SZAS-4]
MFAIGFAVLALAAASLSACAPILFSIATVFLFAGPHNWVEARYFLSRLPARFGKYKKFFAWSFAGIAALMIGYVGIMSGLQLKVIPATAGSALLQLWNTLFVLWIVRLVVLSGQWQTDRDRGLALPFGLLAIAFALAFPAWFGVSLVYLHPLVGCWILDRELQRSKPHWRSTYHACLASIPLFLMAIWWTLHDAGSVGTTDVLSLQITKHAGAAVMPWMSSHMLVAMHTFLEMVHYGVWLIAIPLVSAGWKNWQPGSIPIAHRSPDFKRLVPAIFATSTFAVVVLWVCFALNYSVTRDVYFTLAMAHVLAEVPFLLKTIS